MRRAVVSVVICIMLLIFKYVVSGGFYDYTLQQSELEKAQLQLVDNNKRAIADLENYRGSNYLFSQKEKYGLKELSSQNTILVHDTDAWNTIAQ